MNKHDVPTAKIDAGQMITHAELGFLPPKLQRMPELERRNPIAMETAQRCCNKIYARTDRYRDPRPEDLRP